MVHNLHSTDVLHSLVPPELSRLPLSVAIPNDHLDLGTPSPEHVRLVYGSIWMYIGFVNSIRFLFDHVGYIIEQCKNLIELIANWARL